jgi:hypothetical protein
MVGRCSNEVIEEVTKKKGNLLNCGIYSNSKNKKK